MRAIDIIKKPVLEDWHPADIVCALRKAGWSLRRLSSTHGYNPGSLRIALTRPWPGAERLIAEAIGIQPEEIWPARYAARGQSNRPMRRLKKPINNDTTRHARRNGYKGEAA